MGGTASRRVRKWPQPHGSLEVRDGRRLALPGCCRIQLGRQLFQVSYWVASTTHWWNSARASGVPLMVTGVGVLGVSRFQVQRRMLDGEPDTTTSGLSGMVKAVPGPPVTVSSVGEVVIV